MSAYSNGIYLHPDITEGEPWILSFKAGKVHIFHAGDTKTLCGRNGVRYSRQGKPGNPNNRMNYQRLENDNKRLMQEYCDLCRKRHQA